MTFVAQALQQPTKEEIDLRCRAAALEEGNRLLNHKNGRLTQQCGILRVCVIELLTLWSGCPQDVKEKSLRTLTGYGLNEVNAEYQQWVDATVVEILEEAIAYIPQPSELGSKALLLLKSIKGEE